MRCLLGLSAALLAVSAAPLDTNYVESPDDIILNSTTYTISNVFPKFFIKTEEFVINHEQCVQFSYKLMDKKVKLRAYTCKLSEGGFCTLDKFTGNEKGCTYLRPWTWEEDRFAFYFVLEKRPRKFGYRARISKKHNRLHKRQDSKISGQPLGQLQVDGLIPCHTACNYKKNGRKY